MIDHQHFREARRTYRLGRTLDDVQFRILRNRAPRRRFKIEPQGFAFGGAEHACFQAYSY